MADKIMDISSAEAFAHDCDELDSTFGPLLESGAADIKMTRIGSIDNGLDGRDEYVMLTRMDGDLTPEVAKAWLLPYVYQDKETPGSRYCHQVYAVQAEQSNSQVLCTVCHRFNV